MDSRMGRQRAQSVQEIFVLQPSAIVDHIAVSARIEEHFVDGELGGSKPITSNELKNALAGLG